jgi:L-lysine 2,3-aminomutase
LRKEEKFAIEVVGKVLPFKVSNYVIEELINWDDYQNDPLFALYFPRKDILLDKHFSIMATALKNEVSEKKIHEAAERIRSELNPHPAGQREKNVPKLHGRPLHGIQHKYHETLLFFPSQGQTCHAYCMFCFRWPQFCGKGQHKFAAKDTRAMVNYLKERPEVTDILITGGDAFTMSAVLLEKLVRALMDEYLPNIRTIRFGSRVLSNWPYRFITDRDSADIIGLFKKIKRAGLHVAFMAAFLHPNELRTNAVKLAIERILETGAQIRTQAPILDHINSSSVTWAGLWKEQVNLGCVPYYMFVPRDTGAQHYFAVPLIESWKIFQGAYKNISGICRTVRGPVMSTDPGKVQILGPTIVRGKKVIALQFLQARNPDWVLRPFFAVHNENAIWFDELKPAFGEDRFFFEENSYSQ